MACKINAPEMRNPVTAALMWPFPILSVILMVFFHSNPVALLTGILVIGTLYLWVYRRVALLQDPRTREIFGILF